MNNLSRQQRKERLIPDIPIVYGYAYEYSFKFPCPFCDCEHSHGWISIERDELTHRSAHCTDPDSPLLKTGYYISILKKYDV